MGKLNGNDKAKVLVVVVVEVVSGLSVQGLVPRTGGTKRGRYSIEGIVLTVIPSESDKSKVLVGAEIGFAKEAGIGIVRTMNQLRDEDIRRLLESEENDNSDKYVDIQQIVLASSSSETTSDSRNDEGPEVPPSKWSRKQLTFGIFPDFFLC
ncbi:hypothetical protein FQA39_LY16405 [Lamprigera yunnana]|nr:hypothetical protein FQA39_LY16405 [Lamprigera yunnana]